MVHLTTSQIVTCLKAEGFPLSVPEQPERSISGPCSLAQPHPGGFCFIGTKRLAKEGMPVLENLGLVLAPSGLSEDIHDDLLQQAVSSCVSVVFVENPRMAFLCLLRSFYTQKVEPGIHPDTTIHDSCVIDAMATICAGVRIGPDVQIGARTVVGENCVIMAGAKIGTGSTVGPGTMIGQPGFGYERNAAGEMVYFPHIGSIVIGNNVDIGANTCIDRGTLDATIIHDGAKIDNLCHIAHNVIVGKDAVVIANTMLGGSATIGERAWLAPACTIFNGLTIGHDAVVGMHSLVTKDVPDGTTVLGVPAVDREILRAQRKPS